MVHIPVQNRPDLACAGRIVSILPLKVNPVRTVVGLGNSPTPGYFYFSVVAVFTNEGLSDQTALYLTVWDSRGQPVLVGTISIDVSESLSKKLKKLENCTTFQQEKLINYNILAE